MTWWPLLAQHFEVMNGFPLPAVMRPQAEREIQRLCPGPLLSGVKTLIADHGLSQSLVDALGMGLTWFNREEQGIGALVDTYRRQFASTGNSVFTIWSAGCSMGQEPYSLAMALLEAGALPRILATDLSRQHLKIASKGEYDADKLKMVPPELRAKYFSRVTERRRRVTPQLRRCVSFELHNFAVRVPPPPGWESFDAVVCRNALIYYDNQQGSRITAELARHLRPGGVLLLGTVERPLLRNSLPHFEMSVFGLARAVQASRSDAEPAPRTSSPARAFSPPTPFSPTTSFSPRVPPKDPVQVHSRQEGGPQLQLEKAAELLKLRSLDQCLDILHGLVRAHPLSAGTHLLLGLALKAAKRESEAIDCLRASRFLDAGGWLATYTLAACLASEGLSEEARLVFRDTLKLIESGAPGVVPEIRKLGDLQSLASTVADVCRSRLESAKG